MKTLLLSLTLLITFPAFSQHYRTVATDSEVYFDFQDFSEMIYNNNFEEVEPCRVILTDSFQIINGDTIIYHRFNQEFEIAYETYYDTTYQMNFTYCFSTNDTGFLSYNTILQDDGMDVYFNRFHDSIFIQTQANLNDSWIFHQDSSGHYFEATVSNIINDNFLGLTDSVKIITLQAKDSSGNLISSPHDTLDIRISKHYGLVKGFNLFRFPYGVTTGEYTPNDTTFKSINLIGLPQHNAGIKNLTAADIYDYNIGDEFHWVTSSPSRSYDIMVINGKQFSITGDSVFYDVFLRKYAFTWTNNGSNSFFEFDTLFIGDTTMIFDVSENGSIDTYPQHYDEDSVITYIQSIDGTQKVINYGDNVTWNVGCDITEFYFGGRTTYYKGIGYTYEYGGRNIYGEKREFVYYNKNGNIWGTPLNIDSLSTVSTNTIEKQNVSLKVFPNPATDLLNFQLEEPINNAEIRIYSTLGQLINTQNINDTNTQFNVSEWQNGMYFYGIFVAGEMVKSGQVLIVE
jgi:hypothetical protein